MFTEETRENAYISNANAAKTYIEQGFAPIPVPAGSKKPGRKGWEKERWTLEDVRKGWNSGQNVGLLLGEPSKGLVDLDLDHPIARLVARHLIPGTLTSGRENCPDGHRWFFCDPVPKSKDYKLPKSEDGEEECSVVELRSTGRHTLVEPSIHPDEKDSYIWGEGEILQLSGGELSQIAADVAIAALLVNNYAGKGSRHDYILAASGYLGRHLDHDRVRRIMHAVVEASGDEQAGERRGDVEDTLEKLASGAEDVTGGPTLDRLAPGTTDQLISWKCIPRRTDNVIELSSRMTSMATEPSPGRSASTTNRFYNCTDMGNAERFADHHRGDVLYCDTKRRWFIYDGKRWREDDTKEVPRRAKRTVRAIYGEAEDAGDEGRRKELAKHAMKSEATIRIKAMLEQAQSEDGIPVRIKDLDTDHWLLNVNNGTIDLRTGEIHTHRRGDLITRLVPVDYDREAKAPEFEKFLKRVLPSEALRTFVQRAVGYSLTADTRERILFILHGAGRNGKSTLLEVIREILGDEDGYALKTPAETLMQRNRAGGVPNDIAALKGARFVAASESEADRKLAEALVKEMTGQDTMSARFMHAEWFNFKPTHKTWLATNHKPVISGTDPAIWDRIRLVPFEIRIPDEEVDRALPDKLRQELPGILAWAVQGCLDWQKHGLTEPVEVRAATDEYRSEMDVLGAFIGERCVVSPMVSVGATKLYKAFQEWCEQAGESEGAKKSQRWFGERLKERGFENEKSGVVTWYGIGLAHNPEGPEHGPFKSIKRKQEVSNANNEKNQADKGPDPDNRPDDRPQQEFSIGKGDSSNGGENAGPSGPLKHISPLNLPHMEKTCNKGPEGPKVQKTDTIPTHEPTVESAHELLKRPKPSTLLEQWRRAHPEEMSQRFSSLVSCVAMEAGHLGDKWQLWREPVAEAVEELGEATGGSGRVINVGSDEPYDVYIGRANPRKGLKESIWHNPLKVGKDGTREGVIEEYERYLLEERPDLVDKLPELKGKVLACWCAPEPCHGDVLLRLAESS